MIDIIKSTINIMIQFIDTIFSLKIEFRSGEYVSLGVIVVSFIFIVVVLYLILSAVGIGKKGDDD